MLGKHSCNRSWIAAKEAASSLLQGRAPVVTNRCNYTTTTTTTTTEKKTEYQDINHQIPFLYILACLLFVFCIVAIDQLNYG